jgi:DNA ligase D-like protein (predicted ligase)/DNA ligase D-like protein (predicted 3'-phosphoesterase)
MPLSWDDLAKVKSPSAFTIHNALELVTTKGDAWEGMDAYAVELHTHREMKNLASPLPLNRKRKTPEQLESYEKKRDFRKTPEPKAEIDISGGNNFVVHRHHASHLHYDLRLEQDGVLKSWAVPRGLPPHPGVKRLAVQTEDHPMKYLTFDGTIPKGQYGGGEMWIYALGKYQITKEKKDGFYFKLNSKEINAEYRIHKMKQKEWLMERVDDPQFNFLKAEIQPMLSESLDHPPISNDYFYEVKWDGIRALISLEDGNITIKTRNQQNVTAQFPELLKADKSFRATCGLFDAEIVCLDKAGKPEFKKVIQRMQQTGATTIERLSKTLPVNCYVFDCLYLDGRPLINEPLAKRREWLRDAIKTKESPYRLSEIEEDGESLFAAAKIHGLEGIMAKRKDSKYLIGKRSDAWLKIKVRQSTECFIIGFTPGKGDRKATFGALQIAEQKEGALYYRGKVGTGFNDATMQEISKALKKLVVVKSHTLQGGKIVDEKITTWIEPKLMAEISYARLTPDEMFREPVFIRLRPDL